LIWKANCDLVEACSHPFDRIKRLIINADFARVAIVEVEIIMLNFR
jgi:hypothetical protein